MYFSFFEIWATRFSRSSLEVTSQGPTLLSHFSPSSIEERLGDSSSYGMISPSFSGLWVFAAFSRTSMRRPVM